MVERYRAATEAVLEEACGFLAGFRSLLLATASTDAVPEASYAPFVRIADSAFYVYVSRLARHTGNLDATRLASVLFIEDEGASAQIFARRRLVFECAAEPIAREGDRWRDVMDVFAMRFGDIVELVRPLADFELYALQPRRGVYVKGFAQAYSLEGDLLERLPRSSDE